MVSLIGSKLGPYEILILLGAGGMGEVYRARDSRLKREVAIKILPPELVRDQERQLRFQQEAQAASSLNHPNILVVHDIGVENGTYYMVSELLDGESLGKLIQKGPIAVKRLLDIAVQIADGLAAAHQAGIVHRDLKPENIMVSPENRVKILDFGLAKLVPAEIDEQETLSRALSQSGIIRGTVPYMSPEQASGKTVDFRSDQFSFGLILYEMATGKRAFQRDTAVQVLSAIITEEPPAISTLNPKVPMPLRWLIERCMIKEPRQRYDSTVDLHRDLRNLRDRLSETTTFGVEAVQIPAQRRVWKQIAIGLAFLVGAVAGVFGDRLAKNNPVDLASYRLTRLMTGTGMRGRPAWSPDGNTIAYVANVDGVRQIFTRDLKSLISTQITKSTEDCAQPLWSANGSRLYYLSGADFAAANEVWMVSAAGGPSEKILSNVSSVGLSNRANALAFIRREGTRKTLWISSPPGSEPTKFPQLPPDIKDLFEAPPSFSPDGSSLALWATTAEGPGFWILSYPTGKSRRIHLPEDVIAGSTYSWMPDSEHIVFGAPPWHYKKGHLRFININDGTSKSLTAGYTSAELSPSVSPDGLKIAFTTRIFNTDLIEIPLDGSLLRVVGTGARSPAWSPIGTQYAFAGEIGIDGIWLTSVSDHWTHPIVTVRQQEADTLDSPSISPDGQRVAFQLDRDICVSPVSGGTLVRLVSDEWLGDFPSWSPDGNWISFYSTRKRSLAKVETTGSATPVILKEGMDYYSPRWSPKGDWITCVTEEGLSVISPDGKQTQFLARGNWGSQAWSHDGRTIYGLKFEGQKVWLCSVDLSKRLVKPLNELAHASNTNYLGFSLNPDGSSVLTSESRSYESIWLLEDFAHPNGFFARLQALRKLWR